MNLTFYILIHVIQISWAYQPFNAQEKARQYSKTDSLITKVSQDTIDITGHSLPIGAVELMNNSLPNEWNFDPTPLDKVDSTDTNQIYRLRMNRIQNYYNQLNLIDRKTSLEVKSIETEYIDSNSVCSCLQQDDTEIKILYKLPNINKYEVYYSYQRGIVDECNYFTCSGLGILILNDSLTSNATVLPIYWGAYASYLFHNRYFYISRDEEIFIWDYSSGEDEVFLDAHYKLSITSSSEIEITNLFKRE